MDTYLNRGNAVICTLLAALALAALGNHFSTYLLQADPIGEVSIAEVYEFGVNHALQGEQAQVALNIQADLTSCFNWNTKQLFVYVIVRYETPKNSRNEVIIWDHIITDPEDAVLGLEGVINKYPLRDHGRGLRNRTVTVSLEYAYHPVVGVIKSGHVTSSTYTLPSTYFRYKKGN
ncbi:putative signal peptidase complex subunit 3, related [Neospora caninum Liverpool]|uniref:Signal peptidase complex subunit 3 n=1 Tax=Neospora caninum (strain Liverpool) TaxID=572307 RepID=F0VQP1_NEOCL|nr:putative signal peptidase complex subunit 3, related [Neospora caninum Liverpool]CBZ56038.1 putative signal peptidase complex subunit 3, related [Neospora caninum Liverpool]CEL70785.1 TPA: Probable signal peptidase complex subunit 3, related [Neospora caninum Liverpool]|eukprot:XP_003886064.1 putative signal peptidase complex subunit 3, related [Neospora caninum Liverpool]